MNYTVYNGEYHPSFTGYFRYAGKSLEQLEDESQAYGNYLWKKIFSTNNDELKFIVASVSFPEKFTAEVKKFVAEKNSGDCVVMDGCVLADSESVNELSENLTVFQLVLKLLHKKKIKSEVVLNAYSATYSSSTMEEKI